MSIQDCLNDVGGTDYFVVAQLMSIDESGFSQNQKPWQKIRAKCIETGQGFKAKIYRGSGMDLEQQNINQILKFSLAAKKYLNNVYLQGFWQSSYVHGQQGAAAPAPAMNQNYTQPPSQPAPPTTAAPGTEVAPGAMPTEQSVWDAKDLRMARMNALNRAVDRAIALVVKGSNDSYLSDPAILAQAEVYRVYIYEGLMTENAQQGAGFQREQNEPDAPEPDEWDNYVAGGPEPK